jgi:hypothetical protein
MTEFSESKSRMLNSVILDFGFQPEADQPLFLVEPISD